MRSRPCSSVDSTMRAIVRTVMTRVLPHARLAREHHRVGAVEHRVRDVGRLGTRRHRAVDHRLEHLRGDDDRLREPAGDLDRALLHDRHRLERQLDAEVAARDHDRVERLGDLLERVDGLRLLDLGDDGHPPADLVHDLVHARDVGGVAHERQGDEVGTELEAPPQVGLVLVGERRHVDRHAGQVDALVVRDRAGDDDAGRDDDAIGLDDLDAHLAVVDQQEVARLDVVRAGP